MTTADTTRTADPALAPEAEALARHGLDPASIERLVRIIERDVAQRRCPGAQVAIARRGQVVFSRTFGCARLQPKPAAADDRTLWLIFSGAKVLTAAAVWKLAEQGALRFGDPVTRFLGDAFGAHGKDGVTIFHLLTHQAGFPQATVPREVWLDRQALRRHVESYVAETAPGAHLQYHVRAAHWVLALVVEAASGQDFRQFVRGEILEPIGLADVIHLGLPEALHERTVEVYELAADGSQKRLADQNSSEWKRAGAPAGGGYATAAGMARFYQMLLAGGELDGRRVFSPRMIDYVTRDFTGDRVDAHMGVAMRYGLGVHVRGSGADTRGLGALASPRTFGHGGMGSSYYWADPESGVSYAFISNSVWPEPENSRRHGLLSDLVHGALRA